MCCVPCSRLRNLPGVSAQVQIFPNMPVFMLDVRCPGLSAARPCEFSSDIQGDRAFIDSREGRCQMCKVLAGEPHDGDKMGVQMANLYQLDPDVFEDARLLLRDISEEIWRCASRTSVGRMLASLPILSRKKDAQRCDALVTAAVRLTSQAAGVVKGLAASISSDTCVVAALSSMRCFPVEIRTSILAMACSDLTLLYTELCGTKSSCYHVFDQPAFFATIEWRTSLDDKYDESLVVKLARIYSGLLSSHRPSVEQLICASVRHRRALARLGCAWPARTQTCLRVIAVARRMHVLTHREANLCVLDLLP